MTMSSHEYVMFVCRSTAEECMLLILVMCDYPTADGD